MYLGKVIGTVVATRRYRDLDGYRFLVVQPLTKLLKPRGIPVVAVDTVQSGPGDIVYLEASREASQALLEPFVPVDDAIVGIVDSVDIAPEVDQ
ncbi:MAG: EutN/CcmL family microcompartment protein [Deltaproteobacteria bacterium]|nr:EutN/CcmL family microcompartment protein [Deltaproteobacteria bacterium]